MSIHCAVVGYGAAFNMGRFHCDAIREIPGLELVAVYDLEASRREAARQELGVKTPPTYEELLSDPQVDLVVLVTPHDTHAPLALQALRAGKHVVTEKVMCLTLAEADAMIAVAKERGRLLSVFQNRRWDSDYLTVRKAVESGLLGRMFLIESTVNGYGEPTGWRRERKHGGGMLYDWGAHLWDQIVQLMLPAKPVRVFADLQCRVWEVDTETQALVITQFDNGCTAVVDVGSISWLNKPRWLVRGEKGAIRMEWNQGVLRTQLGGLRGEMQLEMIKGDWKDYYRNLSAVLNEGAELMVKPEEVRISIQIIEAAFRSAELGQAVEI